MNTLSFKLNLGELPETVHVCVDENLNEREQKVEDEPDVNHLDVGRLWQVVGHIDEHCS